MELQGFQQAQGVCQPPFRFSNTPFRFTCTNQQHVKLRIARQPGRCKRRLRYQLLRIRLPHHVHEPRPIQALRSRRGCVHSATRQVRLQLHAGVQQWSRRWRRPIRTSVVQQTLRIHDLDDGLAPRHQSHQPASLAVGRLAREVLDDRVELRWRSRDPQFIMKYKYNLDKSSPDDTSCSHELSRKLESVECARASAPCRSKLLM